jgi:hypothetical protein
LIFRSSSSFFTLLILIHFLLLSLLFLYSFIFFLSLFSKLLSSIFPHLKQITDVKDAVRARSLGLTTRKLQLFQDEKDGKANVRRKTGIETIEKSMHEQVLREAAQGGKNDGDVFQEEQARYMEHLMKEMVDVHRMGRLRDSEGLQRYVHTHKEENNTARMAQYKVADDAAGSRRKNPRGGQKKKKKKMKRKEGDSGDESDDSRIEHDRNAQSGGNREEYWEGDSDYTDSD